MGIGYPEMGAILLVISFWGLLIFLAMRAITRLKGGKSGELNPDETRMIQEIYRGLSSLEKRIESLETILIERYKDRPVPFD